jgi:hypothetical protein
MSLRCIPLVFGTFSCEIISWLGFNNFSNTHTLYRRTCSSFKLKSIKIISISMHFLFLNENSVLLNKLINTSVQQPRRGNKGGTSGDWGHLPPPVCILLKRPWPSHFISQTMYQHEVFVINQVQTDSWHSWQQGDLFIYLE